VKLRFWHVALERYPCGEITFRVIGLGVGVGRKRQCSVKGVLSRRLRPDPKTAKPSVKITDKDFADCLFIFYGTSIYIETSLEENYTDQALSPRRMFRSARNIAEHTEHTLPRPKTEISTEISWNIKN